MGAKTMNTETNQAAQTDAEAEVAELRGKERFRILDKRVWRVKIQDRTFPLDWVHDLSETGMQIRQGLYQGFSKGQKVQIELQFMGAPFAEISARVMWIQRDTVRLNMNVLGLRYEDPQGKVSRKWTHRKVHRFLQSLEDYKLEQGKTAPETKSFPSFEFSSYQVTSCLLFAFMAGFGLSFFG